MERCKYYDLLPFFFFSISMVFLNLRGLLCHFFFIIIITIIQRSNINLSYISNFKNVWSPDKDNWDNFRKHAYECTFEAIKLLFVLIYLTRKNEKVYNSIEEKINKMTKWHINNNNKIWMEIRIANQCSPRVHKTQKPVQNMINELIPPDFFSL